MNYHGGAPTSAARQPARHHFMLTDRDMMIWKYFAKRVNNEPIPLDSISEVNLYEHSPEYLAENYPSLGDKEWYFFTPTYREHPNSNETNRSVEDIGNWKATGPSCEVFLRDGTIIGSRKALVFFQFGGKYTDVDKEKTNWLMDEYKLKSHPRSPNSNDYMMLDDLVMCRIYQNCR